MNIKWEGQPKQLIALKSKADEILFGGSRGGGKTDGGMAWLMYDIGSPKYRALVIRRNYTDLSDWIDRARDFYSDAGGKFTGDKFTFPSGAIIRTGHLADAEAYQKYQGHEYQKMVIEELTHISREADYEKLLASLRSTVEGITPQIFNTTNPDGPGNEWVKDRWRIPDLPNDPIYFEKEGRTFAFIPSKVTDNKILIEKDPKYVKYLESLQDEELKRAWLEGSWEGFGVEGAYYRKQMSQAVTIKGLYDSLLPVYTFCDLGIADSFSIGYFQVYNNEWRVIDYDEFEGESLGSAINRMSAKGYVYEEHWAPHDIEVRELGTGKSRKEIAATLGVRYQVCKKLGVSEGINALRMRFNTLYFDEDKTQLLMSRLRKYTKEFDEKRGVYKDKPVHDINSDAADMMRMWAITDIVPIARDEIKDIQVNRQEKVNTNDEGL